MKNFTLAFFICAYALSVFAQPVCTPDTYQVGPFPPLSLNDIDTMYNGIYYEDVLTVFAPDSLMVNGTVIEIDSMRVDSITGFPIGIDYACDVLNCVFESPLIGCMLLYGTPNDTTGAYDVRIHYCVFVANISTPICDVYPQGTAAGGYAYRLGGSPASSVQPVGSEIVGGLSCHPNPTDTRTNFQFTPRQKGVAKIEIYNTYGHLIYNKEMQAIRNQIINLEFDVSSIQPGTYFYTVSLNGSTTSNKFVRLK